MKPLKLLILNYEYPPIGGGAGTISKFHAEKFAEFGHNVSVVTASPNNTFEVEKPQKNLKLILINSNRKYNYKSSIFDKLNWMFKTTTYLLNQQNEDYDLIIAHFSLPGGYVANKLKDKFKIPYVIVSHGQDIPWFYPKQMFFYHLFLYPIIKNIVRNSDALFVQSEKMFINAKRFLKAKSKLIKIIANGADNKIYFPENRKVEPEKLRLLFAGRLTKQKRPEKLIFIANRLNELNIDFQLTICGDGKLKPKLIELTEKFQLCEFLDFKSWVSREELGSIYKENHILLAPSDAEGMSISILEAIFSGLFIITTPVSGNIELIQHKFIGFLVKNSSDDFVEAILNYKKMEIDFEILQSERNSIIQKFNWDNIAKEYENEFYKIVRNG